MRKIRKGDNVIVISGQNAPKRGPVSRVIDDDKVIVGGLNMVKKHQKPNPGKGVTGGVIEKEMPIHISNVAIFNAETQKADRVGFKFLDDKTKIRIYRSTGKPIDEA